MGNSNPPRVNREVQEVTSELVDEFASDAHYVATVRSRLGDMGWFMKSLKEPIARLANQADETSGAFWQSRYKSIAILDTEALLAVCAYIDLNVFAAGIVEIPEISPHTSLRQRIQRCQQKEPIDELQAAQASTMAAVFTMNQRNADRLSDTKFQDDQTFWLCPIEDRRHLDRQARPGLMDGFSFKNYLRLVDWTSRLVRKGKARVSQEVSGIFERLGTNMESWKSAMMTLFASRRHTGVAFAFSRERLREAAAQLGRHHLANLNGCPA